MSKMQEFWNKLFNILCESYQDGVSHVTNFSKTAKKQRFISKKNHPPKTQTHVTVQVLLAHIPTWHTCDQPHSDMYHTSLYEEADISVKGCTNWGWSANNSERGEYNYNRDDTSQQSHCHTQFQALQCADSRQVQHTKIHQFTGDRTANTKCGKQYRLQLQAFYVKFCSRYSSGGADYQLYLAYQTVDLLHCVV